LTHCEFYPKKYPSAMSACRSPPPTSWRPHASPVRVCCAASSTRVVECMMPAHARLLAGSTGSTASCLDCLAAALQILVRRHTPPRGLQMSRRGSRGAAGLFGIACGTDLDVCRSLRGTRICALSVNTRASLLVERSTVMRIATMVISYRVQCSDEYDNLAQDHIRHKSAAKQPSQDR
jgi:hypothetical protein